MQRIMLGGVEACSEADLDLVLSPLQALIRIKVAKNKQLVKTDVFFIDAISLF
jgi:hypothetical protein